MADHRTLTGKTVAGIESDSDPAVVELTDNQAGDLLRALTSKTARQLLECLRASPSHPPRLADETDLSIQNVHDHLNKLEEAGAIEVVDTVHSVQIRATLRRIITKVYDSWCCRDQRLSGESQRVQ